MTFETLRNDKYARTWLIRILINEGYTLLRKSRKLIFWEEAGEMAEVGCIFLCGSTAVPEERKPPVRWKETVKPEQGYRT